MKSENCGLLGGPISESADSEVGPPKVNLAQFLVPTFHVGMPSGRFASMGIHYFGSHVFYCSHAPAWESPQPRVSAFRN